MCKPWIRVGSGFLILLLLACFAAGCDVTSILSSREPSSPPVPVYKAPESSQPSSLPTIKPSSTPTNGNEHTAQVSANSLPIEDTVSGATKPKVEKKDAYHQEKPTLMGLQLDAPRNKVLQLFGEAQSEFVMDEETDPIHVLDYNDFSVGFNAKNELEFVNVHSADIDPGLGGVRLGQRLEEAIQHLGNPDSNTKYVLSYRAQGTVLKLDIDPHDNTIQSIKLFANRQ